MSLASNHATNAYCTDVVAEMKKAIRGASNADGSTTAAAAAATTDAAATATAAEVTRVVDAATQRSAVGGVGGVEKTGNAQRRMMMVMRYTMIQLLR